MRKTNETDTIMSALEQRFDYGYGIGFAGFEVEDGNDGHLLVMNHRKDIDYEVTVKFRHGEYKCKIDKRKVLNYKDSVSLKTITMVSDDPQEVVDWVIKMIAPSAKTIDINESRHRHGRMLREYREDNYTHCFKIWRPDDKNFTQRLFKGTISDIAFYFRLGFRPYDVHELVNALDRKGVHAYEIHDSQYYSNGENLERVDLS